MSERGADACVHALGVTAGLAAIAALMILAIPRVSTATLLSLALYGIGLAAMLGLSAAYNLVTRPALKAVLRRLDHAAIFVMIAGTYTPFSVTIIGGAWGTALLAGVWAVAVIGVCVKLLAPRRFERAMIVLYLVQGWAVLAALEPLVASTSASTLALLAAGGVIYTVGVLFYLWHRLRYHRAIWHAFVLAAAACHYVAVLDAIVLADGVV